METNGREPPFEEGAWFDIRCGNEEVFEMRLKLGLLDVIAPFVAAYVDEEEIRATVKIIKEDGEEAITLVSIPRKYWHMLKPEPKPV